MRPGRWFRCIAAGASVVLVQVILQPAAVAQQGGGECLVCHVTLDDDALSEPATAWEADTHNLTGLTCTGCHGGDAATAIADVAHAGMVATPTRGNTPDMCGRCHANADFMRDYDPDIRIDQLERYYTSRHGQRLLEGDDGVATCVDCHSAHSIQSSVETTSLTHPLNIPSTCGSCHADEEHMSSYGIATDQLDEYERSIHWKMVAEEGDLSSPVCNDCHGNHGAVPPGHSSVGRVCGECHFQIETFFAASPHDSVFVGLDRPGCATCHGNHDIQVAEDEQFGLGDRSTCTGAGCHTEQDEGGVAAARMKLLVDSLVRAYGRSDSILHEAELAGMPVDQARFELAQVQTALVSARAVMHSARLDSVGAKIDEGLALADAGFGAGEGAFVELSSRRLGLAVSAVVIFVLVIGLILRIRELEMG
ncbi:MAG: hypothetical protein OEU54_09955 [Gemmatimonadota bacterium]|nr:hypothetical protein [Gemmatimonadota bacterium]